MENLLNTLIVKKERQDFKELIHFFAGSGARLYLRNEIIQVFRNYCDRQNKSTSFRKRSSMFQFLKKVQELFISDEHFELVHRYAIAKYRYYLIRMDGKYIQETTLNDYLNRRDRYALRASREDKHLSIDFMPFYDFSPTIRDIRTVGSGIRFLNRYMAAAFSADPGNGWINRSALSKCCILRASSCWLTVPL